MRGKKPQNAVLTPSLWKKKPQRIGKFFRPKHSAFPGEGDRIAVYGRE
jgi:hypothetical protein